MFDEDGLTLQIWRFVAAFHDQWGMPPTQREIARKMPCGRSGVVYHLRKLAEAGMIRRLPGKARGIVLLERPPVALEKT